MPPKRKARKAAAAIDLTEEASPEKKPARVKAEALVKSVGFEGKIAKEVAEALTQTLEDEATLKETRAKAEGGDGYAMYCLGVWYEKGEYGLAVDKAQARSWYERSAAARDPKGIAAFGNCLLLGIGGPEDHVFGIMNVTEAAGLGSDLSAYRLGWAFFEGGHGLSKDPVRARYWLKKIADGECEHKHLQQKNITEAAEWLRELDQ